MNIATSHTVEPTRITGNNQAELLIAHRMVEQYLGASKPLSFLIATYTNVNPIQPLSAVEGYPIDQVNDATDSNGASLVTTNDDRYVWVAGRWSTSTITLQYVGGIEAQIFDAIMRQASVLADRDDEAPERTGFDMPGGGDIRETYNPQFRTGLSPDVRHMLFPYKQFGF